MNQLSLSEIPQWANIIYQKYGRFFEDLEHTPFHPQLPNQTWQTILSVPSCHNCTLYYEWELYGEEKQGFSFSVPETKFGGEYVQMFGYEWQLFSEMMDLTYDPTQISKEDIFKHVATLLWYNDFINHNNASVKPTLYALFQIIKKKIWFPEHLRRAIGTYLFIH